MKKSFQIFGKRVGEGGRCFIIAEAGSNHNGSLETALRLIDVAVEAEADAVKFQTFEAKRLYPKSAGQSGYLKSATPIFDIIKAMEMPVEWLAQLAERAHALGLAFIASPFHEEAVDVLDPYVDAFKVASYELTHEPLLRRVAAKGKPVVLSTGASTIDEARGAVETLTLAGCDELVVLQCTAAYPTPPHAANVNAVVTLRDSLGVATGLSDHTRDPVVAPMTATALGAAVIEKHYTLSNDMPGPDHAFAVEPQELAQLVRGVRNVESVLGSGEKLVLREEDELRGFARRSVFTIQPVRAGQAFTRDNVDVLRHGEHPPGLPPSEFERVLASKAAADLPAETPLREGHLAPTQPQEVVLRRATPDDSAHILRWANDPDTRGASFSSEPIASDEHEAWFRQSLRNPQRLILVANAAGAACGIFRLDIDASGHTADVGLNLAPEARGRGLAVPVLTQGTRFARGLGIQRLVAYIKPSNSASVKSFMRAGYVRKGSKKIRDQAADRYELLVRDSRQ